VPGLVPVEDLQRATLRFWRLRPLVGVKSDQRKSVSACTVRGAGSGRTLLPHEGGAAARRPAPRDRPRAAATGAVSTDPTRDAGDRCFDHFLGGFRCIGISGARDLVGPGSQRLLPAYKNGDAIVLLVRRAAASMTTSCTARYLLRSSRARSTSPGEADRPPRLAHPGRRRHRAAASSSSPRNSPRHPRAGQRLPRPQQRPFRPSGTSSTAARPSSHTTLVEEPSQRWAIS
jgi:hypothetical protein